MAGCKPALELRSLARRFGERAAIEDLSLMLPAGATLAVLGANGAGKTTLLRLLAGLLRPHGGEALVLGARLPGQARLLRGRIGWIGHEPLLYRELTARQNLAHQARLQGLPIATVEPLLERVGLRERAGEPVRELSRGMIQRLAAARAMLPGPELLLLDEPHANLDPAARALLEPMIGRAGGLTRVISSHDPAAAVAEADLVLGLRDGRSLLLAEPAAISGDALAELYR